MSYSHAIVDPPAHRTFNLSKETTSLLRIIESTHEEIERRKAIFRLADQGDRDSCRVLMETYNLSMWRETKKQIIRAICSMKQSRGTEFVITVASDESDLGLAASAVESLAFSEHCIAAEFLSTLSLVKDHPLRNRAVVSMAGQSWFPAEYALMNILSEEVTQLPAGIVRAAVLALGYRCFHRALPVFKSIWDHDLAQDDPELKAAIIMSLGQIGNEECLEFLNHLDVGDDFTLRTIRGNAIGQIQANLGRPFSDVIEQMITAPMSDAKWKSFFQIQHYDHQEVWQYYVEKFKESGFANEIMVRSATVFPERLQDDLDFLGKNFAAGPDQCATLLKRQLLQVSENYEGLRETSLQEPVLKMLDKIDVEIKCLLAGCVNHKQMLTALTSGILTGDVTFSKTQAIKETNKKDCRFEAVNGLAFHALMNGFDKKVVENLGAVFAEALAGDCQEHLKLRIIRALGQINWNGKPLWELFQKFFDAPELRPSLYYSLAKLKGEQAAQLIDSRLALLTETFDGEEFDHLINCVSQMGVVKDPARLSSFADNVPKNRVTNFLKILAHNFVPGTEKIVQMGLLNDDFQHKMLALAAAKYNGNDKIWRIALELKEGKQPCLAGRALDSLCIGGRFKDHKLLLDALTDQPHNYFVAMKIFRSLKPEEKRNYLPIIRIIDKHLAKGSGIFADKELVEAATNLRDNLELAEGSKKVAKRHLKALKDHELDLALSKGIEGFSLYSETVKSILRNAELTYTHPELFDERVDKSTIVVEYVKSIDLLLQEKIGSKIFLTGQTSKILTRMQSRLVFMQLEGRIPKTNLIRDLQCDYHFSADEFPGHKMSLLSYAITSGKIQHDQYRTIDGLRAWAILLLLFGRDFKFRSQAIKPIFAVNPANNAKICKIAANLNKLQVMRNDAAHRGTMLKGDIIEAIRVASFGVLTELNRVL